jgi:alkylated DNA nucleotide flippase Atl1
MMTLEDLGGELRDSKGEWRWHVARVIQDIPAGYLCTYGAVAREVNRRTALNVSARNVAWLRAYLYGRTSRDTSIPLHRLTKVGDSQCHADSERTTRDAMIVRTAEGSWRNPQWWEFCEESQGIGVRP